MNCDEVIIEIEKAMGESGTNWRQYEIEFEGKVTRGLKRKVKFNLEKLGKILEGLDLKLTVKKI